MKKSIALIIVSIFFVSMAYADGVSQHFMSIRGAGMGGADVAVENGIDALNVNPALMQQIDGHFQILSVKAAGNKSFFTKDMKKLTDFSDHLNSIGNDENKSDGQKIADIANEISALIPLRLRANIGVTPLPGFMCANFIPIVNNVSDKLGLASFANSNLYAGFIDTSSGETIRLQALANEATILGLSKKISEFNLDVGVGIKYVVQGRTYNKKDGSDIVDIGADDLAGAVTKNFDAGKLPLGYTSASGVGYDLGFLTDMPFMFENGKLGLVFKDLGSTKLTGDKITDVSANTKEDFSDTIPMTAKIGCAGDLNLDLPVPVVDELFKGLKVAIDYDLISDDVSFFKRVHFGAEKALFSDMLKLRIGNNQGNMSYGAALDLWMLHLAYANYTEELGRKVGINPVTYSQFEVGLYF